MLKLSLEMVSLLEAHLQNDVCILQKDFRETGVRLKL